MLFWLANTLEAAKMWALMRDSSILRNVWSPFAPIQVALLPYRAPTHHIIHIITRACKFSFIY